MSTTWIDRLQAGLLSRKCPVVILQGPQGKLLVSVFGARVLGCQAADIDQNLFWHNPLLEQEGIGSAGLECMGGDRLWIAPEAGFIFTNIKKAIRDPEANAKLPAEMDPGNWKIRDAQDGGLRLATDMTLTDYRNQKKVVLRVARQIHLSGSPADLPKNVDCFSFAMQHELTLRGGDEGAAAGVWNLVQLPTTGWLICPTVNSLKSMPSSYYRPFGDKHVKVDAGGVRFLIDGQRKIKMGLSATQTTGRMGYWRMVGKNKAVLIVRYFGVLPGEAYVDMPLERTGKISTINGDVLQAYNHHAGADSFGEMEHHDPAIVVGRGPSQRIGQTVTHVISGAKANVAAAGKMLLGVKI